MHYVHNNLLCGLTLSLQTEPAKPVHSLRSWVEPCGSLAETMFP